jgi:polyribonucleotide nucleotidyltransferase
MDFKVCGTADGITACQMDIKINGLSSDLMAEALEQARKGRLFILDKILEAMPAPREDYREFVPRIVQMEIPRDMIGAVIGTAGKVIQEIQRETNTIINIEEKGEFGIIDIAAPNLNDINRAVERIEQIIRVPEVGETYHGIVKSIMPFGAFVEIFPGTDGLLHVSEISYQRVNNVEDVLKEGDEVDVKLISIDEKTGKYKLSMRALMPKPEGYVEPEARPRRNNDRDRRGGGRSSNGNSGGNRDRNGGGRR